MATATRTRLHCNSATFANHNHDSNILDYTPNRPMVNLPNLGQRRRDHEALRCHVQKRRHVISGIAVKITKCCVAMFTNGEHVKPTGASLVDRKTPY